MSHDSPEQSASQPRPHAKTSRRRWLRRAAWSTVAIGAGCVIDTFFVEPHWLEITRRDLPIAGLPAGLRDCTLAQVSDIHIGYQVSEPYLVESFASLAAIEPDIVVVTGDYMSVDPDGSAPLGAVQRICEKLPHGRLATLGILGNHDNGINWKQAAVAKELVDVLGDCGVQVLRNETSQVDGLQIVGVDDLWSGQCSIAEALGTSTADAARLVLCHNPDAVDLPGWDGYRGWILSGHTHGGQCKPPFLPPPMLPVHNRRYTSGAFELDGGRRLYINRGLGHLLQVRFNVRPEITLFRLTTG